MAVRRCPNCMAAISPMQVVAYSYGLECLSCKSRLTVWDGSRLLAGFAGVLAGVLAWQLTSARTDDFLGWTLPVLFSFLAFGAVSSLFLIFTADLRFAPEPPAGAPVAADAGHGSYGGGHH
jgi:hypothetical protein